MPQYAELQRELIEKQNQHKNLIPHVQRLGQTLLDFDIPESLDHGDFHLNNIFLKDGEYKLLDWGDASVSHPFASLGPLFTMLKFRFGLGDDSEHLKNLRNIYLASWLEFASAVELTIVFDRGQRISRILAVLRWKAALSSAPYEQRAPYLDRIPGQMRQFLKVNEDLL